MNTEQNTPSAQPTPSGPTAGDSMDVHYAALQGECVRMRAELDKIANVFGYESAASINEGLVGLSAAILADKHEAEQKAVDLSDKLDTAETKAGAMEVFVGDLTRALTVVLKHIDEQNEQLGSVYKVEFPKAREVLERTKTMKLPPAPSVASEKEGKISNETVGIIPTSTTPTKASSEVSAIGVEAASHLLPFNLAKALAGAKVVTRDGREVRDLHLTSGAICGYVEGSMFMSYWNYNGWFQKHEGSPLDLFLAPTP